MSAGAPGPQARRDTTAGKVVYWLGIALLAWFAIWAVTGFYPSQVVPLFLLGGLGVAGMWLGARINKGPDPNKAVEWKRSAPTDVGPTPTDSEPTPTDAETPTAEPKE